MDQKKKNPLGGKACPGIKGAIQCGCIKVSNEVAGGGFLAFGVWPLICSHCPFSTSFLQYFHPEIDCKMGGMGMGMGILSMRRPMMSPRRSSRGGLWGYDLLFWPLC